MRAKNTSLPSSGSRLPSFVFVGGKGGVGKTTCAAALALESSRHRLTLLVSTDPASSLGDALGMHVAAAPRPVPRAPRLRAVNVDAARAFNRWIAPRRPMLADIALRGTYLDEEDIGRLLNLSLPGVDEVVGLLEIARVAARGYERVVVDTAPTGHTLRLLSSPALLERVAELLDAVQEHYRDLVGAIRGSYTRDSADALIEEIDREGRSFAARLRDPDATSLTWVTLPEPMALAETSDAVAALARDGLAVRTLIVNRTTPPPPGRCEWCEGRRRFEARAMAPISRHFPSVETRVLPQLDVEPRGVAALGRVAATLTPYAGGRTPSPIARRVRAHGASAGAGSAHGASAFRRKDARAQNDPATALELASPRWILFGGKGGVGKSTCAAAFALHLAARHPNRRVLLVSSDPAHSLGDVLAARLGDRPLHVARTPGNLRVREIDAPANLVRFRSRYLDSVDAAFAHIARGAIDISADHAAFKQLIDLAPPGIDEVIAVAEMAESLETSGNETIVTDTAPTGHALRLLQTPAVLRDWAQALMAILLKYREIVGAGPLAELLVRLSKRVRRLETVLRDPSQARFVVVTRAAALPRAETVRLVRTLAGMRITAGGVIVNAVGAGTCARCRAIERAQAGEMEALLADLAMLPAQRPGKTSRRRASRRNGTADAGAYAIIEAPAEVPPPHGAAALAAWITSWRRIT